MPEISRTLKNKDDSKSKNIDERAEAFSEDLKSRVQEYSNGREGIIGKFFGVIAKIILCVWKFGVICLRFGFFGGIAGVLFFGTV